MIKPPDIPQVLAEPAEGSYSSGSPLLPLVPIPPCSHDIQDVNDTIDSVHSDMQSTDDSHLDEHASEGAVGGPTQAEPVSPMSTRPRRDRRVPSHLHDYVLD